MSGQAPFRLRPWPFEAGEVVTLAWVRSPYKEGPEDQWKFGAVFRSRQSEPRELSLDWAMLPLMALGQYYRDGEPLENRFETANSTIDLSKAGPPELMDVRDVLPRSMYRLDPLEEWQEQCWVWTLPGKDRKKFVVPVLVLLRGRLAQGDFFTTGLLNGLTLDTPTRREVEGNVLHLRFQASFPLPVPPQEREAFLTLLARLLCDPSFENAYRSVALGRVENPNGPLKCDLPELSPQWGMRVLSRGNVRLVQEILQAEPLLELPVEGVAYVHPLYPRRTVSLPRPKTTDRRQTGGQPVVDYLGPASKRPRTRHNLSAPTAGLVERHKLTITNEGREEEGPGNSLYLQKKGKGERLVSLADKGRNGTAPQAGVRMGSNRAAPPEPEDVTWEMVEEWAQPQEDGLNTWREMLATFWQKYPRVNVVFRLGPKLLPGQEKPLGRPYAVVALAVGDDPPLWLIEFAHRPERKLSTLVLWGEACAEWDTFEPLLIQVLLNGLDRKEWWNLAKLEEIEAATGVRIRRLPHSPGGVQRRAERIFGLLSSKLAPDEGPQGGTWQPRSGK
ncbi:hypothetical protein [Deinococcus planocerae]|uniref:hypothetical protein n=1 Tax=Deinococcus planocerae TaxID=1737569 RepID=UPI0015E064AE|nr:hypothetical protein [Deinococcus planocerae]